MVYDSIFNVLFSILLIFLIDSSYILTHFQFLVNSFFNLFFVVKLSLGDNSYMISCIFSFVNNFFKFFRLFSVERREWDSNPCALADKRFSRPPRYDHFDISPYISSIAFVQRRKIYYHLFQHMSTVFFIFLHFCILRFYLSFDLLSRIASAKIRSSGVVIFIL